MKPMEENLEMPVGELLQLMQERIVRGRSSYFGIHTLKSPLDLWVYQEIIFEKRPDVLLEIGNYHGGSALALAHMLDQLDHGRIIAVDRDQARVDPQARNHPRITWIESDAVAANDQVRALLKDGEKVMVLEDSKHSYDNTLAVLRTYQDLVPPGQYFVIEDSIGHHGLDFGPSPGAYEAIEAFIEENENFAIDRSRESFMITWSPKGFLLRI
jgi:cephalosporin hydroxylase